MTQNQHYVPQFYLKHFSVDGKNINIYNVSRKGFYCGPLRTQCAKPDFYSEKPDLEKAFSLLEGKIAATLDRIMQTRGISISLMEYVELLSYIGLQKGRTLRSAKDTLKQINSMFDYLKPDLATMEKAKKLGVSLKDLEGVKISHKHPALQPTLYLMQGGLLLHDLQICLIVNNSKLQFLTSDDPVIFKNPFFSGKIEGSQVGLASKGLCVFFPVSPQYMLLLYDPKYYILPLKKDLCITVSKKKDIKRINGLQIIHALDNVYFNDYPQKDILDQHSALDSKRGSDTLIESLGVRKRPEGYGEIIHFTKKEHPYNLRKLSFLSIVPDADEIPGPRNPKALEEHRKFTKDV